MLHLISAPVAQPDPSLPTVAVRVERRTVAKRRWRAAAEDGTDFGVEVEQPLKAGDTLWQTATARYVIVQEPEPVLEIALAGLPPSAIAGVGWAVGNLHLEFSADPAHMRTPDEPAARQLLARIQIPYTPAVAVFRPGRFTRHATTAQDLGPSHQH